MTRVPGSATPLVFDRSYRIEAQVGALSGNEAGVLVAVGDVSGGYALYLQNGRLVHEYHYLGRRQLLEAPVPAGSRALAFEFEREGPYHGTACLQVDRATVAEAAMTDMARNMISWGGLSIGVDALSPVSFAYPRGAPFSGQLESVVFELNGGAEPHTQEVLD